MKIISLTLLMGVLFTTLPIAVEHQLQEVIQSNALAAMQKPKVDSLKSVLGQKLFFDKILSGNKDISCATCHHPSLQSADGLTLPIGAGGKGLGKNRILGYDRSLIPRNSPEIFNRGADEWQTMFWDSRVSGNLKHGFDTPADEKLPDGFDNILAVQAMFPVLSRDEMRGDIGDHDIHGKENELALISNAAPQSVWNAIMQRILQFPEYRSLFKEVYPSVNMEELGFEHAANAIAAFEIDAFTMLNSPWDEYLSGNKQALSDLQKQGAVLFYGKANCSTCHSGNLMTDQKHHNIAVPQFGPGKGNAAPLDVGRFAESGKRSDRFAFRTPPLRNVEFTAPYMHNGAYQSLEDAIRHHLDPATSLKNYESIFLDDELESTYQNDEHLIGRMIENLDPELDLLIDKLNDEDVEALLAFMQALTDSGLQNINRSMVETVPSGLPVDLQ